MKRLGFTLAELLIALAILGVIATFSIPKVLQAQQDSKWKAMAKEAASTFSAAYDKYKQVNGANPNVSVDNLTPYMNFVKMDTSAVSMDNLPGSIGWACNSGPCLRLHNGGVIQYGIGESFGGSASTNAIFIHFDPDGKLTDGTANGPGKAVEFDLYYNGKITSAGYALPNTTTSLQSWSATPSWEPSWFSWD
jgi:prepilin-type N-terminal cleavage/methylation domain-containing protein